MDQELIAYLDKRFGEVDKRFGELHQQLQGEIRGNGVEIEGLRGQIQQVAEGVAAGNQNLESFRTEVSKKFDEMGKLFHTSHSNLHSRVSSLEDWREKVEPSPPAARKRRT
jgi:predicted nuclease with TOPRIM domain